MSAKYAKANERSIANTRSVLPVLVSTELPHEYVARERARSPMMGAP